MAQVSKVPVSRLIKQGEGEGESKKSRDEYRYNIELIIGSSINSTKIYIFLYSNVIYFMQRLAAIWKFTRLLGLTPNCIFNVCSGANIDLENPFRDSSKIFDKVSLNFKNETMKVQTKKDFKKSFMMTK